MEVENQPTQTMPATRTSRRVTETKQALRTTEFWIYIVIVLATLIAGLVADGFGAEKVWLYVALLTIGYMISRGLAKAGSHDPEIPQSGVGAGESIGDRVKAAAQVLREGEGGTTGTHPATGSTEPERRNY